MREKSNKNEINGVEKGFKPSSPDFYCSLGIFGFFFKITVLPLHSQIEYIGLL